MRETFDEIARREAIIAAASADDGIPLPSRLCKELRAIAGRGPPATSSSQRAWITVICS